MGMIPRRTWALLEQRSALALFLVTLSGLVAGIVASLAGASGIAHAAWLASAACGLGYAVWSAAGEPPPRRPRRRHHRVQRAHDPYVGGDSSHRHSRTSACHNTVAMDQADSESIARYSKNSRLTGVANTSISELSSKKAAAPRQVSTARADPRDAARMAGGQDGHAFQRPGIAGTGRCACTTTADDTLPRSTNWTRDRPRGPTTISSASSFSASSQIARHLLPFATLPKPQIRPRGRGLPLGLRSHGLPGWRAHRGRVPSKLALTRGVQNRGWISGGHSATGSHTVSTTAARGPSSSPAFAIALAASSDPSKHKSTGCASSLGSRPRSSLHRPVTHPRLRSDA